MHWVGVYLDVRFDGHSFKGHAFDFQGWLEENFFLVYFVSFFNVSLFR